MSNATKDKTIIKVKTFLLTTKMDHHLAKY
jgi:hypothetical protein